MSTNFSTSYSFVNIGSIIISAPRRITSSISFFDSLYNGFIRTKISDLVNTFFNRLISSGTCMDFCVFIFLCRSSLPLLSRSIQIRSVPACSAICAISTLFVIYINLNAISVTLFLGFISLK